MNEIVQSLYNRKSVRVFEERIVEQDIKEVLIDAALQAPTAGNQVLYSMIDVTDEQMKLALSITCDNQPFIAKAPIVVIFVADHTRWVRGFELAGADPRSLGVGDLMLATADAMIAAQNMVVAAESFGLGSCYIGDILENAEKHQEMLNLPSGAVPVCMLVIGYPTKQQKERKKPARFDKKYVVGHNTYPQLSDDEMVQCHVDMIRRNGNEEKTLAEHMVAFCKRKFNSEFSREMTRSVKKYLEDFE